MSEKLTLLCANGCLATKLVNLVTVILPSLTLTMAGKIFGEEIKHWAEIDACFPFSPQIVLQCNEVLRTCLDDREVGDAALGLLDMYKRLLRTGIIFKVGEVISE